MNTSNPCAIDDVKLIQAVESKELLFNKGHHFYKNVIQKENAWREIAEECFASVDAVKKRWKILRDRFVRELRNYGKSSKDDTGGIWERFEQLIFLRHHVNHKNSLLPLTIDRIKTEDQKPIQQQQQQMQQPQQLSPQLQQQQQLVHTTNAVGSIVNNATAATTTTVVVAAIATGTGGYETPAENTVDTYDHTIKYMFSEDDGIQPEILEGDELLNEFLIRKKRDTSVSPTHSNGGAGGAHKGISDMQLIAAIRERKCLYEKGNANYKNIAEKEKMWKQVADECGADSVRVVRSRWKQLRDRFGREMKSAQPSKTGWKMFDEMLFIKDHVNVRSALLNTQDGSDDRVKSELEDNGDVADCVYVDGQRLNVPRMIALIKNSPVLYDKSHRHYHNEARKDQAWESIAGDLQIDETAIKTQWQAVQDKYQRERKLAKKSNGVSAWPLLDSLDFLKQSSKNQAKNSTVQRIEDVVMTDNGNCQLSAALVAATSTNTATISTVPNHLQPQHHNLHPHHHHAVVIVSAPSADNSQHPEVLATYSTNVAHQEPDDGAGLSGSGMRKRRRDTLDELDGLVDDGGDGSALERRIERVVKRIVTQDGNGGLANSNSSTAPGSTYEEEFFSKFICEKLKSFPKKLRADAKSHIFQYLHELDNTLQ